MIGTLIGIILIIVLLGVVWWAIMRIWPIIAQYVEEPFRTIAYVLLVVVMVLIAIWVILLLLGVAGIHVPMMGSIR